MVFIFQNTGYIILSPLINLLNVLTTAPSLFLIMDTESQALLLRAEASGTLPLSPSLPPSVSVSETDSAIEGISHCRRRRQTPPPPPLRFKHPEDIGQVHKRLFSLPNTIVWTREQHMAYWRWTVASLVTAEGTRSTIWSCRLFCSETRKPKGKGERAKMVRMGVACDMKLRDTIHLGSGGHTIVRHRECVSHNHSLDDLDATKKLEALHRMASGEIAQGYTAPAITQTLHASHRLQEKKAWLDAGGKFFSHMDVHNSGSKWKDKNPDPRFIGAKASWQEQRAEAECWFARRK